MLVQKKKFTPEEKRNSFDIFSVMTFILLRPY